MSGLKETSAWNDVGQWCWIRMLVLQQAWAIELPCYAGVPNIELEKSIDGSVSRLLHHPETFPNTPSDHRPWVLARLVFGSGLLQPRNLHLLEIHDPVVSDQALEFLLREEWRHTGRELWPATGFGENSPRKVPLSLSGL